MDNYNSPIDATFPRTPLDTTSLNGNNVQNRSVSESINDRKI
jgi:hypothetical protein